MDQMFPIDHIEYIMKQTGLDEEIIIKVLLADNEWVNAFINECIGD